MEQKMKDGDTVQLREGVADGAIPDGRQNHRYARIYSLLKDGAVICAIAMAAVGSCAYASGGKEHKLEWPVRGEVLVYRSCGCADSCWTAEVRDTKAKKMKFRLHCDCEILTFSNPSVSEHQVVDNSCTAINDSEDKFGAIRATMERLVGHREK